MTRPADRSSSLPETYAENKTYPITVDTVGAQLKKTSNIGLQVSTTKVSTRGLIGGFTRDVALLYVV
jgi:hypothetical protein